MGYSITSKFGYTGLYFCRNIAINPRTILDVALTNRFLFAVPTIKEDMFTIDLLFLFLIATPVNAVDMTVLAVRLNVLLAVDAVVKLTLIMEIAEEWPLQ